MLRRNPTMITIKTVLFVGGESDKVGLVGVMIRYGVWLWLIEGGI